MELLMMLAIPALAAVLCLVPAKRPAFAAGVTVGASILVMFLAAHTAMVVSRGVRVVGITDWIACDGFGALILLLVAYVGLAASIFSWSTVGHPVDAAGRTRSRRYFSLYNLFLMAMLAVPVCDQVSLVWIALELTTLTSVFLVCHDRTPEAFEAAWKYAILTTMGAILALFGILLLYWGMRLAGGDVFTWEGLAAKVPQIPAPLLRAGFILILIGLGSKAGMAPLHSWLPDAYSQAPVPICILLSFVETATIPYVIFRLWPRMAGPVGAATGTWLVIFGLISAGVAALLLIQVKDVKRLFAFSTIEHHGIILVAAGLGGAAAGYGASFQIMTHIITKSFCFFAVGAAFLVVESREIASIRGLIRSFPIAGAAVLLGALAVSGAPPFAVFLSEFSILKAGLSSGQYLAIGLLVLFIGIAFCAILYHSSRMVFGKSTATSPPLSLPVGYATSLFLTAIPMVFFWIVMPETLDNLLRLAGAVLGR